MDKKEVFDFVSTAEEDLNHEEEDADENAKRQHKERNALLLMQNQ